MVRNIELESHQMKAVNIARLIFIVDIICRLVSGTGLGGLHVSLLALQPGKPSLYHSTQRARFRNLTMCYTSQLCQMTLMKTLHDADSYPTTLDRTCCMCARIDGPTS